MVSFSHLSLSPNFNRCRSDPTVTELEKKNFSLNIKEVKDIHILHPLMDVNQEGEFNEKETTDTISTARSKLNFICEGTVQSRIRPHTTTSSSHLGNCFISGGGAPISSILDGFDDAQTRIFLTRPVDKDLWLKCQIDRKICDKKIVKYYMTLADSNKFLLYVIKKPKKSYNFYMTPDAFAKDKYFMGKLKSNFFGTEFSVFDSGSKPKKEKNRDLQRSNVAVVTYVRKIKIIFIKKFIT
jgi:hypothetical protein